MSFCAGFEKTSASVNPANIVGQAAGYSVRGAAATTRVGKQVAETTARVVKEHGKRQKASFLKGYSQARGPVADAAKGAKGGKASFARRHPYMTAGLLYLGTKAMLGGGEDKSQQQQPQYVGPQQ